MNTPKREILLVVFTAAITILICSYINNNKSYQLGMVEQELNITKEGLLRISEEYNIAMLNIDVPLGTQIHGAQFECNMMTFKNGREISYDQLPKEDGTRCKIFESIDLYQNLEGEWYFDKSSGVDLSNEK